MLNKKFKKNLIRLTALFLGLTFFGVIPILILELFKINYDNLSLINKAIVSFIGDLIFLIILLLWNKKTLIKDFKNYLKNPFENLETSFKYWLIGFIMMVISNFILLIITNGTIAGNEELVREMIDNVPLFMAFSTIIYAPFTEEIIFRKCIRDVIESKWLYIIISGLVFGAMHIIGSANNLIDILYIIPYSSLGIAFAYTYYKTNNIFSTISMHLIHNTLAFLLYIIM